MNKNLHIARWFLLGAAVVMLIAAGITPWMSQRGIWVDPSGSDTTGSRNHQDRPFRTITAAVAAAQAGDTIYTLAGIYTNQNNLLKRGVNYYFYPGAVITYMESTTGGPAYGVFDDRTTGATTNIIGGYLNIVWNSGTNFWVYDVDCNYIVGNTNALGACIITNANSKVTFKVNDVGVSGFYQGQSAFFVQNCTNVFIDFNEIYDPYVGIPVTTNAGEICETLSANTLSIGLNWYLGEMHARGKHIAPMTTYAIQSYGGAHGEAVNEWVTVDNIDGKIYLVGLGSMNYRVYVTSQEIISTVNTAPIPIECHGSGNFYFLGLGKVQSFGGSPCLTTAIDPSSSNLNVFISGQKMASSGQWIDAGAGTIESTFQRYEDTAGTVAGGFLIRTNSILNLYGGHAFADGKTVEHRAGKLWAHDVTFRSTNNTTIFATNNGVLLHNCLLISKTTSNAIESGVFSANVGFVGGLANRPKSGNVTIQPGTLPAADTNLQ